MKRFTPRLANVKSHMTASPMLYTKTPNGHVLLNELADVAAGLAADRKGLWASEIVIAEENVELLWRMSSGMSHIEQHIRERQSPAGHGQRHHYCVGWKGAKRRQAVLEKSIKALSKLDADHGWAPQRASRRHHAMDLQ